MAYFETDNVRVFPSSFRTKISNGKYNSEHNFVNILNSIVDKDSYVLSSTDDIENNEPLRVVIHGYYFEIEDFKDSVTHPCYLKIRVEDKDYSSLVNYSQGSINNMDEVQGDISNFTGIVFESNADVPTVTNYTYYVLQITNDNSEIVNNVRLSTDSIFYNSDKDLTTELNSKQTIVKAGNGIKEDNSGELPDSKVELIDPYNSILNSVVSNELHPGDMGSNSKPIFIEDNAVKESNNNAGSEYTGPTSGGYKYTKAAYMKTGNILTGTTFFISKDSPDLYPNSGARDGDFWFKYTD